MKQKILSITLAVSTFMAFGAVAAAHVVVTPRQVNVAEFQTFDVSVPNEKETNVTALKLLVPAGLAEVSPTVKPGWTIEIQKNSKGEVSEIDWTGGSVPPEQRDDFTFNAQAPARAGELDWKAYQTYADGSIASWDQKPAGSDDATGDTGPYSVTKVINDLTAQPSTEAKSSDSKNNWTLGLAIAALALSVIALLKTGRK
jgi:uncharacterized protein YcnI